MLVPGEGGVILSYGVTARPIPSGTWVRGSIKEVSVPPIPLGYQTGPPSVTKPVYIEGVPTTKTFDEGAGAESVGAVEGLGVENVLVGEEAAPLDPTAGRRGAGAALDEALTPARCHPQGAEDIFGARWHKKKRGRMEKATGKCGTDAS